MLDIKPTLSALLRSKAGAFLLLIQIAIATAIVSNASFIAYDRITYLSQETGYPEDEVFSFIINTFGDVEDLAQQYEQTENLLRNIPGVVNAVMVGEIPLSGSGSASSFATHPLDERNNENYRSVRAAYTVGDENIFETLGLDIAEGRSYMSNEVIVTNETQDPPPVVVATRSFVDEIFPEGDGLGKTIYFGNFPAQIIGIIDKAKGPWLRDNASDNLLFFPYVEARGGQKFIVRTSARERSSIIRQIEELLIDEYQERVVVALQGMDDAKAEYNAGDILMVRMILVLIVILILITALGIFGLTVFNINKRTKQIGTRRALGARKSSIIKYFLVENGLVCFAGLAIGCIAAIGLGQILMEHYSVPALNYYYVAATAVFVFVISLLSVLFPANRASNISPSIATRTI